MTARTFGGMSLLVTRIFGLMTELIARFSVTLKLSTTFKDDGNARELLNILFSGGRIEREAFRNIEQTNFVSEGSVLLIFSL